MFSPKTDTVPFFRLLRRGLSALAVLALVVVAACDDDDDDTPPPPPPTPPENPSREIGADDDLPGIEIVVTEIVGASNVDGTFLPGDTLTVRYTAKTADGADLDVASLDGGSIYVSGPTFNYQRVIAEQTDLRAASVYEGEGVWSYRFAVPLPATFLAPLNDTASFSDGELTGQNLLAGTYSVAIELDAAYEDENGREFLDAGTTVGDFLLGGATDLTPRAVSQADNCNVCHTELRAHDNRRKDVRTCVLCHTAGAEDNNEGDLTPGVTIEFKVMIHKLHNGSHQPSVLGVSTDENGARVYPGQAGAIAPQPVEFADAHGVVHDYSAANFPVWPNLNVAMPRDAGYSLLSSVDPDGSAGPLLSPRGNEDQMRTGATACAKCHGDPDADGPLLAPAQGALAFTQPTRRACGSCHDDIDWSKPYVANGQTMPAQADDSTCKDCHSDYATNQGDPLLKPLSVFDGHLHPLSNAAIDPGVNSVITAISGGTGANGNFQIGDTPTVTFTLKNDAGDDIGLSTMDSAAAFFFGPTSNQQLVMPYPSPNGMSLNPYDFTGRLQASSTNNKGSMSKVVQTGPAANEILVVQFTSSTVFNVNRVNPATGAVIGPLGSGTLPASPSTNPSGSSVSAIELGPNLASGSILITFSSPTHFDVSGLVTGAGDLPAATSASTRFSSADLSFNLSVGSTAFAAGNEFRLAVLRGGVENPVLFAIVAGRTSFASGDRFYYEVVPDAATYTLKIPMDLPYEFLGDTGATPTANSPLPPAGNLPVQYGRQVLWEVNTSATTTTTVAALSPLGRQVDVNPAAGFLNGDVVVIEPLAGIGQREYVQIAPADSNGVILSSTEPGNGATSRLYFKTPLRYAHAAGVTITKVTLSFRQEGAAYTLDPATGIVTSGATPFTANRAIVMSYRSDARFGYKRHGGDTVQAGYVPPGNDSADLGQEVGDWQGLPYLDGTYTADIWLYKNVDLGLQNELQTLRSTSNAGKIDFLYGAATEIQPKAIISDSANCYACHDDVIFHGGGRRGVDACLTCHSISGVEDKPRWDTPKVGSSSTNTALTPKVTIDFREMLHKIHMGRELAAGANYVVVGNGGTPHSYEAVEFPPMPGGPQQCVRCHGNDAWKVPGERVHPSASSLVKTWTAACGSCHDSSAAQAHISSNTSAYGVESCSVCHGAGSEFAVEKVHKVR